MISFVLHGKEKMVSHKEVIMEVQPPQYLYKIISLRNWQSTQRRKTVQLSAEDSSFIHFSTEEQLEKIIKKYWCDVPQFIVLKIDTHKVEGTWSFETNPGGTNKYYHLYDGCIPLSSILEARTVYQHPMTDTYAMQN